jgi:hypothetical protein
VTLKLLHLGAHLRSLGDSQLNSRTFSGEWVRFSAFGETEAFLCLVLSCLVLSCLCVVLVSRHNLETGGGWVNVLTSSWLEVLEDTMDSSLLEPESSTSCLVLVIVDGSCSSGRAWLLDKPLPPTWFLFWALISAPHPLPQGGTSCLCVSVFCFYLSSDWLCTLTWNKWWVPLW